MPRPVILQYHIWQHKPRPSQDVLPYDSTARTRPIDPIAKSQCERHGVLLTMLIPRTADREGYRSRETHQEGRSQSDSPENRRSEEAHERIRHSRGAVGQRRSGKKQVPTVLNELGIVIERHVKKGRTGQFTLPRLLKIEAKKKPATKARRAPTPSPVRRRWSRPSRPGQSLR